jgi:hypothetical protein
LEGGLKPHRTQKLYYATASETWPERQPVSLSPASARIDVRKYVDTKIASFRAHVTQLALLDKYGERSIHLPEELFHLAAAVRPQASKAENDLFGGIEGE